LSLFTYYNYTTCKTRQGKPRNCIGTLRNKSKITPRIKLYHFTPKEITPLWQYIMLFQTKAEKY